MMVLSLAVIYYVQFITGHVNATKIIMLATKIQKLVAKLATKTLWVLYILP